MTTQPRTVCPLCGDRARRGKEHALPQWVHELLSEQSHGPYETLFDGVVVKTTDFLPPSTTRRVCRTCNDWLNKKLENPARPILTPLIKGECAVLAPDDQRVVGAWCAKTALLTRLTRLHLKPPMRPPPFADELYRHLRDHGEPAPSIRVWIGGFAPSGSQKLQTQRLTPTPRRDYLFNGALQPSTFTIGHLAVQLVHAPIGDVSAFDNSAELLGLLVPVWPPGSTRVAWPPRYVMDNPLRTAVADTLPLE